MGSRNRFAQLTLVCFPACFLQTPTIETVASPHLPEMQRFEDQVLEMDTQEIVNISPWEISWVANQGDVIYFKVKDPTSGGQGGASYPGGITKLVDMKIIYKGEIIASLQQYFTHTNDGCHIYATTVP